ncbi:MAG: hypothetical protein AAGF12_40030 [Myxococcota bacterium]
MSQDGEVPSAPAQDELASSGTAPEEPGGRVLLERERIDDEGARYRTTLTLGSDQWVSTLAIQLPELSIESAGFDGAPPWLVASAEAFLKTVARTALRDPTIGWPRRVNRWRPNK